MGRTRRSRQRGTGGRSPWVIIGLVALVVIGAFGAGVDTGSGAFTSAASDRGASVDVASDDSGLLGINIAASVTAGSSSQHVTVANNLNRTLSVDVASSATLSNSQATLGAGESLTTDATVSCTSPPSELELTITADADGQFSGVATRSVPVDTSNCADSTLGFGTLDILDQSTSGKGSKAEYAVSYSLDGDTSSFKNVSVDFENLDRTDGVETRSSSAESGTISFQSGGQRFGDQFEITVRLFDDTGEIQRERVVVTDTADGSGTVYSAS
jgi:hypothetical protein